MFKKTKFKLTLEEMLRFQQDCDEAARQCPQYLGYWGYSEDEIYSGKLPAKELVKSWLGCDTLWEYGYSECLSQETLDIIEKYHAYKAIRKLEKRRSKMFSMDDYSKIDNDTLISRGARGDADSAIALCMKMMLQKVDT